MNEADLIAAIKQKVGSVPYSYWTIGITDDPERRKGEHDNPRFWQHWKADGESIARNVEKYFLDGGMKGGTGGGENPTYVYVF